MADDTLGKKLEGLFSGVTESEQELSQGAEALEDVIQSPFQLRRAGTKKLELPATNPDGLDEFELLYKASREINMAQNCDEILAILYQYGLWPGEAHIIAMYHFDTPWRQPQVPEQINLLAQWIQDPQWVLPKRKRMFFSLTTEAQFEAPIIIKDTELSTKIDKAEQTFYKHLNIRSAIYAPLMVGDQTFGLIASFYQQPPPFDQVKIPRLMTLISQAAATVQNLMNLTTAQRRADELAVLNRITQIIPQRLNPEAVLDKIYLEMQRLMKVDVFFVGRYNPEQKLITYPIVYDSGERCQLTTLPTQPSKDAQTIIDTGLPLNIHRSPEQIEAEAPIIPGDIATIEKKSASLLYAPLLLDGQTIGLVSVQSYLFNAYSQREIDLLLEIASYIAVVVENAHSFDQVQMRAQREQQIHAGIDQIRRGKNTDEVLQTTVQQLQQIFGAKNVIIHLGTQANLLLKHAWVQPHDKI